MFREERSCANQVMRDDAAKWGGRIAIRTRL